MSPAGEEEPEDAVSEVDEVPKSKKKKKAKKSSRESRSSKRQRPIREVSLLGFAKLFMMKLDCYGCCRKGHGMRFLSDLAQVKQFYNCQLTTWGHNWGSLLAAYWCTLNQLQGPLSVIGLSLGSTYRQDFYKASQSDVLFAATH